MFSRRRIILGLLLLFALALLSLWANREPAHQNRTLSQWLAHAESPEDNPSAVQNNSNAADAAAAIRAIGPKALPHLLRMLNASQTTLGDIHRALQNGLLPRASHVPSHWELRRRGFVGLQILGPAAAPALPEILKLIETNRDRTDLWFLLESIGASSAPAAPLFESTFAKLMRNPEFAAPRPDPDFHPIWLANDLRLTWGGGHRQLLADQLRNKTNTLISRISCLWSLRKDAQFAQHLFPAIAAIIADPAGPPLLKTAALHALGRIPHADPASITLAIEQFESQFTPLPINGISNGDFALSHWSGTNQPPNDPKAPSKLFLHWLTWNGVVGRNLAPGWKGAKIELAPRVPPGSVSQVFRTTPGTAYQIQFDAAAGRNLRARVTAGHLDETIVPASGDPVKPTRFKLTFRALSPLTTLTFSALDHDGYGPFIDNVIVTPVPTNE